ncbi:serine/threonine protein kinase, partial [Pseudoloma neurophilia]
MNIKIIREIGIGGTSKVYEGLFNGRKIAIKRILKKNNNYFRIGLNEIYTLSKISHPYIIDIKDVIERNNDLIIIFELHQKIPILFRQELSEIKIIKILRMICLAVNYLHQNGIMHRDLKLDNILITEKKIKIADFGLATSIGQHTTICGTKHFMAPEIGSIYDEKIDIYNIGVIAYHLVKRKWTEPASLFKIEDLDCSKLLKDFINLAMKKNPKERPNCENLLLHPIFEKFLPKIERYDNFPDFIHKTSVGTIIKEGNSLELAPFKILNGTFFMGKMKLLRHEIYHEHLRLFYLMQKTANIYRENHRHSCEKHNGEKHNSEN